MPLYRVWPEINVAQNADEFRVSFIGPEFGDYLLVRADSEQDALDKAKE